MILLKYQVMILSTYDHPQIGYGRSATKGHVQLGLGTRQSRLRPVSISRGFGRLYRTNVSYIHRTYTDMSPIDLLLVACRLYGALPTCGKYCLLCCGVVLVGWPRHRGWARYCYIILKNIIMGAGNAILERSMRRIRASAPTATEQEVLSMVSEDSVGINIQALADADTYTVVIQASDPSRADLRVHWAMNDWELVPEEFRPDGTVQMDDLAVQTPLDSDGRVVIRFPSESCPSKIVFVLKEGEKWTSNGAGDFVVYLKPPGADEIMTTVFAAETEYERWSLFDRVNLATSLVDAAIAAGPPGMGFIFTWLRLSSMKVLPWYKGSNYQSKDAAHAQKVLAQKMANLCCNASDPLSRHFARLSLSTLPRGGGNGDDIRMGILHIMRQHGIREGHRPGIEDVFLETWHQKLHTNTTPEDVTICEAYLAFLHSGDMGEFWRVAWENGRITPEYLSQMDHPINPNPFHLPQLIDSMKHYLWILKTTHAGADLDVAYEMVRGNLDGDLAWMIGDFLANRDAWWAPGKIVEIRQRLSGYWRGTPGCSRDILLLDIALDSYFRVLVERMEKASLSADDLINLVSLVLSNSTISCESDILEKSSALWRRVFDESPRWSGSLWARMALAAADTLMVSLEDYADSIAMNVQPYADRFGEKCSIEENYILNFSEEVVRGQSLAVLGPMLQHVSGYIRQDADMGSWEIVSSGTAGPRVGKLQCLENLDSIQGATIEEPTIFVVDKLTGNEDIPENVECIITGQATDVLSHIAIRARAQSVLLATCFDASTIQAIKDVAEETEQVQASVDGTGTVLVSPAEKGALSASGGDSSAPAAIKEFNAKITPSSSWSLEQPSFSEHTVGGKALNLHTLFNIPSIRIPKSLAIPYGTYEKVIADPSNAKVRQRIETLTSQLATAQPGAGIPAELAQLRHIISDELQVPHDMFKEVSKRIEAMHDAQLTISSPSSPEWSSIWKGICHVWASVWNDRAWLSRRTMNIPDDALYMSVLLQELIPAQYSFVLHTSDPITGAPNCVHGELVLGMGEALVGNFPGRALSFAQNDTSITITTYPSKIHALYCDRQDSSSMMLLMARSDSNGEDLQEFAGAGLYSSVPIPITGYTSKPVSYADEQIIWNDDYRQSVIESLITIAQDIESACGSPQDIEGVIDQTGTVHIVQTRPQIIHQS